MFLVCNAAHDVCLRPCSSFDVHVLLSHNRYAPASPACVAGMRPEHEALNSVWNRPHLDMNSSITAAAFAAKRFHMACGSHAEALVSFIALNVYAPLPQMQAHQCHVCIRTALEMGARGCSMNPVMASPFPQLEGALHTLPELVQMSMMCGVNDFDSDDLVASWMHSPLAWANLWKVVLCFVVFSWLLEQFVFACLGYDECMSEPDLKCKCVSLKACGCRVD